MMVARWMTWLVLGAAPLACAAQALSDRVDILKDSYFGLNVGKANYKFRNPSGPTVDRFCNVGTVDCRKDPIGWKLTAGYMIWRFFGIEATAFNMGQAHDKSDLGGGNVLEQKVQIRGFGLSAVGAIPLGPVSLNARAGLAASTLVRKDR